MQYRSLYSPSAVLAVFCSVFLFTSLALAAELPNSPREPFADVPRSSPYFEAVEYLRTNDVLLGYMDGTFHLNRRISRADFVHLMTNPLFLHGRQDNCVLENTTERQSTVFFHDVPKTAAFAADVCVASVNDLVHGYPDGNFRPQRPVSFVEAAKVIARVFSVDVRRDSAPTDNWYTVYVDVFTGMGAVPPGIDTNSQRALARPITRGEMAWMIYRVSQSGK